jgi:hypothetical protein
MSLKSGLCLQDLLLWTYVATRSQATSPNSSRLPLKLSREERDMAFSEYDQQYKCCVES